MAKGQCMTGIKEKLYSKDESFSNKCGEGFAILQKSKQHVDL